MRQRPPGHQPLKGARRLFELEKVVFRGEAASEAGEGAVGADDSVAGGDDGNWILAVGGADCAYGFGIVQRVGDLTVRSCLAEWNFQQLGPHGLLKVSAAEV